MEGTDFAQRSKDIIELYSNLKDCGVDELLELLVIVVIGDQSSGKSSLIERIAKIQLPKGAGTCTRVPIEIQMMTKPSWNCSIQVKKSQSASESVQFSVLRISKDSIHATSEMLRLAQLAILVPEKARLFQSLCDSFVSGTISFEKLQEERETSDSFLQLGGLHFSQDRILVKVEGPDLYPLVLVDLPGIIQSTEDEKDENLVDLVEQLTVQNMTRSNTIVVATLDMSIDLERQKIWKLVKKHDQDGSRTVGVLTKSDLLQDSQHTVLELLKGSRYSLKNGHFLVINSPSLKPDDNRDLNTLEKEFILKNMISSSSPLMKRVGAGHLSDFLSNLLVNMMSLNLQPLKTRARDLLDYTREELKICGPCLNPRQEMDRMISLISLEFEREAQTTFLDCETEKVPLFLFRNIKALLLQFAKEVHDSRNDFFPSAPPLVQGYQNLMNPQLERFLESFQKVKVLIAEDPSRSFPGDLSSWARLSLIRQCVSRWNHPLAVDLCEASLEKCLNCLINITEKAIPRQRFPDFLDVVKQMIRHLANDFYNELKTFLSKLYDVHFQYGLSTFNGHYFEDLKANYFKDWANQVPFHPSLFANAGIRLVETNKLSRADEECFLIISSAFAFIKVIEKAWIDEVCASVDYHLLTQLSKKLESLLKEELGLYSEKPYDLRLDPAQEIYAQELFSKQKRLEEALKLLSEFSRTH
jgi:GTPase SAR1 family protein